MRVMQARHEPVHSVGPGFRENNNGMIFNELLECHGFAQCNLWCSVRVRYAIDIQHKQLELPNTWLTVSPLLSSNTVSTTGTHTPTSIRTTVAVRVTVYTPLIPQVLLDPAFEDYQPSVSTAPAPPGRRTPAEDVAGAGHGTKEAAAVYMGWGAQDVGRVSEGGWKRRRHQRGQRSGERAAQG
eukprot:229755-Pelagomonas_calceolata.AAC.1